MLNNTRSNSFAFIADLMHHLRAELTPEQIQMVCSVALRYMHNLFLANQTTVLASKITFQMIDAIITKFEQPDASRLIRSVLDSFIDKLESMVIVLTEVIGKYGKIPDPASTDFSDFVLIEKARPMAGATYAVERPDELVIGEYYHSYSVNINIYPTYRVSWYLQDPTPCIPRTTDGLEEVPGHTHS